MKPSQAQINALVAASPDIRPECIRQANENVEYLTGMAKSWIINGDEHHGAMLQGLCLAFGFQQTEIERLRVDGTNRRAALTADIERLSAELSAAQAENEALRKAPPDPITDFDRASGVDHWIGRASYWYERTQEEVRLGAMQRLSIAELTADLAAARSALSRVEAVADELDTTRGSAELCHDTSHDDRYCSRCESIVDGLDVAAQRIRAALNSEGH